MFSMYVQFAYAQPMLGMGRLELLPQPARMVSSLGHGADVQSCHGPPRCEFWQGARPRYEVVREGHKVREAPMEKEWSRRVFYEPHRGETKGCPATSRPRWKVLPRCPPCRGAHFQVQWCKIVASNLPSWTIFHARGKASGTAK